MNWTTYIKNIVKSRSNLVTRNIQLSEYIADMHVQHAMEIVEIRADRFLAEHDLHERIDELEKKNADCVENMLIHVNEKRGLINLLKKMQTRGNKND
jgi:hypothetical protein